MFLAPFWKTINDYSLFIYYWLLCLDTFIRHFEKYGEITDSVIMKDRYSGRPRGFGFITFADPSVVDRVIQETHVINGKEVSFFFCPRLYLSTCV